MAADGTVYATVEPMELREVKGDHYPLGEPERVDLSAPGCTVQVVQREDPAQWKIPDLDEIWSGIPGLGRG